MRRGRSAGTVAFCAILVSACAWTQYGGSAARTGIDTASTGLTVDNVAQLSVKFTSSKHAHAAAVTGSKIYVSNTDVGNSVDIYPTTPTNGCTSACPPSTTISYGPGAPGDPALDGTSMYVAADLPGLTAQAYDLDVSCSPQSTPPNCARWSASLPLYGNGSRPTMAVDSGRVYVQTPGAPSTPGVPTVPPTVSVFDTAGQLGCTTNVTTTCEPLFQAATDTPGTARMPTVADGRLFVGASNGAWVFDATGAQSCPSGRCLPLFRLASPGPFSTEVAVRHGRAYAASGTTLMAFDATGHTDCGGTPVVCTPIWTASLDAQAEPDLVVTDQIVAVTEHSAAFPGIPIEVFSTTGQQCDATGRFCGRLWATTTVPGYTKNHASASASLLVVSGWTTTPISPVPVLEIFDLAGVQGCNTGVGLKYCAPLRTIVLPDSAGQVGRPAIAANRIVIGSDDGALTVLGLPD